MSCHSKNGYCEEKTMIIIFSLFEFMYLLDIIVFKPFNDPLWSYLEKKTASEVNKISDDIAGFNCQK